MIIRFQFQEIGSGALESYEQIWQDLMTMIWYVPCSYELNLKHVTSLTPINTLFLFVSTVETKSYFTLSSSGCLFMRSRMIWQAASGEFLRNWPINNARQVEPLWRYHDELMGRWVFPDIGHDFFIWGDVVDRVDHELKIWALST